MRFEGIVRPYQTRDIAPPKVEPRTSSGEPIKTVKFDWGKGRASVDAGSVNTWTFSGSSTNYMEKQQREEEKNLDYNPDTGAVEGPPGTSG